MLQGNGPLCDPHYLNFQHHYTFIRAAVKDGQAAGGRAGGGGIKRAGAHTRPVSLGVSDSVCGKGGASTFRQQAWAGKLALSSDIVILFVVLWGIKNINDFSLSLCLYFILLLVCTETCDALISLHYA